MATTPDRMMDRAAAESFGLETADLLAMYRTMVTSRRIDDRELLM